MDDQLILHAEHLIKTYRKGDNLIRPLNDVTLAAHRGECIAVMGPSGSGKSTLLHILGGLDRPDSGSCQIGGVELTALSENELCRFRARHIGFVFQAFNLIPVLTAAGNVELPLRLFRLPARRRKEQVETALGIVGLAHRARHLPSELSGGEEQRVAIARALVTDPDVILADEPTGNLDEDSSMEIMNILKRLTTDLHKTVVLVTHDSEIAARADRIYRLTHGRLEPVARDPAVEPARS